MTITLYEISVPIFIRGLSTLSHILTEAEKYAKDKDIPTSEFVEARLYPDMLPLSFQVQTASDISKSAVARVAGTEPVSMKDNETTIEELQDRIARTIVILKSVKQEDFEGREDEEIVVKDDRKFTGRTYFQHHSLPNFLFHVTMAYGILRSKGVPLGKRDYLKYFYPGISIDLNV
jgi:uncharacterized protein